jgi:hypothetical protein
MPQRHAPFPRNIAETPLYHTKFQVSSISYSVCMTNIGILNLILSQSLQSYDRFLLKTIQNGDRPGVFHAVRHESLCMNTRDNGDDDIDRSYDSCILSTPTTPTTIMATVHVSSRNPFRSLLTQSSPPDPDPAPEPEPTPQPVPPPIPPRPAATSNSAVADTGLSDELPPAYTPSPDARIGESTIEYGPRRPFQPPPGPPPPRTRPNNVQATIWSQLTQQYIPPPPTGLSSYRRQRLVPPAPNHPPASRSNPSLPPPSATSEFARDFYAAGAGDHELTRSTTTAPGNYAPPPGPPPPSSPTALSSPGDNQPTSAPKPGHLLLRDGKLLVYPSDFVCPTCASFNFTTRICCAEHVAQVPMLSSSLSPSSITAVYKLFISRRYRSPSSLSFSA